ncbi:hypothetical protein ACIRST_41850 [Kitasatospora sp. NPDC101447]|uniref:hypothetical protein n=1 Tax=Kitasatospora sp. NPDC101447 TaxID=3364102 RepID=UPI003805EC87
MAVGAIHPCPYLCSFGVRAVAVSGLLSGAADRGSGGNDWILHTLADLCLDQSRPDDGLPYLDNLKSFRGGDEEWDLFRIRLPLIAASAGAAKAVEQARAHPEGDTSYAAGGIAALPADAGRTGEAVAVLEQHPSANRRALAGYLTDLGRHDDAAAMLQRRDPGRPSHGATPGAAASRPDRPARRLHTERHVRSASHHRGDRCVRISRTCSGE